MPNIAILWYCTTRSFSNTFIAKSKEQRALFGAGSTKEKLCIHVEILLLKGIVVFLCVCQLKSGESTLLVFHLGALPGLQDQLETIFCKEYLIPDAVMKQKEEKIIEKIQKLYKLKNYSGTGALTLQSKLFLDKGWHVSLNLIYKALKGNLILIRKCHCNLAHIFFRSSRLCGFSQI